MSQTKIIYGFHALKASLNHHPENILHIYCVEKVENARLKSLIQQAKERGLVIQPISKSKLEKLTQSEDHQGVAATIRKSRDFEANDVLDWLATTTKTPLLLLLEGIQDPHNVGACLRSAEALGVDWVVLPKNHTAPLNATVSKVASGADQTLPIVLVSNLVRFIEQIKEQGVWVVGTGGEADAVLSEAPLTRSVAILMGAEGAGLKRLAKEHCDQMVKIPMLGTVSSLNVSVATGICLYECYRQRSVPLRLNP